MPGENNSNPRKALDARIMLLAGEASGDTLGAELARAIRAKHPADEVELFGAGGPKMAEAGVALELDLTEHAVVGIWEALKNYRKFKSFFHRLFTLARTKEPDAIVLIDNPGFNLRFTRAIREHLREGSGAFKSWKPKLIGYVSPQLWAWHESRVRQIAEDIDLMLSIFPFEKQWYAERAPDFPVEFVGHPIVDRFPHPKTSAPAPAPEPDLFTEKPLALLLPGSRERELARHLPVMLEAARRMAATRPVRFRMVLPNRELLEQAEARIPAGMDLERASGDLSDSLDGAAVAIASSGTVTLECAWFRVPTVVLYKTSPMTYWLGRLFIRVEHLAMPNLLARESLFPEFIQGEATAENLSKAALKLLDDQGTRLAVLQGMEEVAHLLGEGGAADRAARAILKTIPT